MDGAQRWKKTLAGRAPLDPRMQAICARLRAGATYKDIAEEFGISESRVGQIREYAGIERRYRPRENAVSSRGGSDEPAGE